MNLNNPKGASFKENRLMTTPWERRLFSDSVHTKMYSTFYTNQNTYIYFHLVIVLSVLRLTTSDCHFSIFKICLRIFLVRIADKVFQLYFVGFFEEKLLFNQTLWTIQRHWQH